MRKPLILAVLLVLVVAPLHAGFTAEATVRPGLEKVKKVVIVTAQCHEVFNCSDVERRVHADFQRLKIPLQLIPQADVQPKLLDLGVETYSTDLRAKIAEAFGVDAIVELELPHGEARTVFRKGSQVSVKMRIVSPSGEILMLGNGAGRALNTVSSPESIAQETFERILRKAYPRN